MPGNWLSGRSTEQLREAETALRATGAQVAAHAGDVGSPDEASRLIEATVAAYGGIDILVNIGGGGGGARIGDSTDDDWRGALERNLIQTVRIMRLALPHMKDRPGAGVIDVASESADRRPQREFGARDRLPRGGVAGMDRARFPAAVGRGPRRTSAPPMRSWRPAKISAALAAPRRIGPTSPAAATSWRSTPSAGIRPAWHPRQHLVTGLDTGRGQWLDRYRLANPAYFDDYVRHGFPMGRLGTAEEVADVIVFVASPRAYWINGRNIPVDGLEQPHAPLDRRAQPRLGFEAHFPGMLKFTLVRPW
jgi:NAD(P)-dependent dehydrogenase (short-subunit alcohol dehydrogenase family)